MMLTTVECAELLSAWANAPGGYDRFFILGEIRDNRLIARVNHKAGTRKRARVRIHPDDLMAYVVTHHRLLIDKARHHFAPAA